MILTVDNGTVLAMPVNDQLLAAYESAIELAVFALRQAGHFPTDDAIGAARSAAILHVLQMAGALGGAIVPTTVGETAAELARAMAALHPEAA